MRKILLFIGFAICGMVSIRAICYGVLAICSMMYGFNMPELTTILNIF